MGIINGYLKTKRYRKQEDNNYILQSELTMSDTVEFDDGTTLTDKMSSVEERLQGHIDGHDHNASDINGGTLGGQVSAPADTDYTTNRLRNNILVSEDPGKGVATGYANGSIISVYE